MSRDSFADFVVVPVLQWAALCTATGVLFGLADGWHSGCRFEHGLFAAMLPGLASWFLIWSARTPDGRVRRASGPVSRLLREEAS